MKKTIPVLFTFFLFTISNAQSHVTLGAEINVGGNDFTNSKTGVGASVEYVAKLFPNGGVRVYAGYNHFSNQMANEPFKFVPVRAGYQHFLYSDNLFVYGEAGITNFILPGSTKAGFSGAAGLGYKINVPKANLAQLSVFYNYNRYTSNQNYNWWTLRAAFGIKTGKRKTFKRDE